MPDASSDNAAETARVASPKTARGGRPVFDVPLGHRLRMILLGYIPLLHLSAVIAALALPLLGVFPRPWAWLSLAVLYLSPALICRAASWVMPMPDGIFELATREFLRWWFYAQWQVIFNRFPALEEGLRMVPGLYSQWLRLWGARVGSLVYWSSGVTILDRPCLDVGDRVVFGAGVVLSPHNLTPHGGRRLKLLISKITVGHDTMIGGQAILSPGARIAAEEMLPAFHRATPFSTWEGGRRARRGSADWATAAALVMPSTESRRAKPS